ncbi:MAG: hypothetical protein A2487_20380 [Candidatus Raymondbacteria bacterium RifOxyC12_full_50_8]|uniref:Peptidase G2 IMC autoproteolytic cleavage domain-containing protein n=1 Tax=Candidatus Raymondbacteria bacterium RIFOXYD12_FULL_49_13 TaxID=1817890 RepID=A0A1F7FAI5_UNCRA|nr:MAG: hypothetical protein A2248_22345 [Candidatus Raymondbacteria bacterium RIFOXYA2_FULL_49_16]OGJ94006.1 MAG: hypothetical protein A2350_19575 [Candidatus Raymondbacteria bacterium RifOxyB12_full_50_8]OGJ96434.1 MAG: hypothetical protein A2487_20380 [Candidatus Raymondbacteria bacterium RifOxyC12_full_50_8]OGK03506.1 MAG: hypothetical protein A2519_09740 [Candidatus Raymondbacteria bacterium RIFOXYD12_FULL_49_13]OGP42821.1 MAG: hypothetical protein A2324_16060 [Candidatus Raymondbacteria b
MANYPTTTTTPFTSDIVLTDGGRVGIGTTSMSYPLDILKDGNSVSTISNFKNINTGNAAGVAMNMLAYNAVSTITKYGANHASEASNMKINNVGGDVSFAFSGSDRVRIKNSGRVGIGSTNPSGLLDINGNSSTTSINFLSGNSSNRTSLQLGRSAADTTLGIAAAAGEWNDYSAAGDFVLRAESGKLLFVTNSSNCGVVISGNNVGIGITNPDNALEVAGCVKIESLGVAFNLPIPTSDPGSLVVGDVWIKKTSGTPNTYFLKLRTSDGDKQIQFS